jgi:hypothetical protein
VICTYVLLSSNITTSVGQMQSMIKAQGRLQVEAQSAVQATTQASTRNVSDLRAMLMLYVYDTSDDTNDDAINERSE